MRRFTLALVTLLLVFAWFIQPAATPTARAAGAAPLLALTVSANHLLRGGQPFIFHGVNRDSLEWGRDNWGGCGGDGHFTAADFDNIAAWSVNTVRLPLSQANWLGRRCNATAYLRLVDQAVALANSRGMYVILDLHWTDVGGKAACDADCLTGQQPMPDADSVRFWHGVAARYAGNPGVLFGLFNEPHDVPWACWRDGGCTVTASTPNPKNGKPVTYTAVGMQQIYDTVRTVAPDNVVLVGGLDWAYDLSGVGAGFALRGTNIVYDTHVYTQWHSTVADWDAHFGFLTAQYPVVATEFGAIDCTSTVTQLLLAYFDAPRGIAANRMGWTIWSWNSPGQCSQPSVLADWSGTPLAGQGQLIHDTLLTYGSR